MVYFYNAQGEYFITLKPIFHLFVDVIILIEDAHYSQTLFLNRQSNLEQKAGKDMLKILWGLAKYHHMLYKEQLETLYNAVVS